MKLYSQHMKVFWKSYEIERKVHNSNREIVFFAVSLLFFWERCGKKKVFLFTLFLFVQLSLHVKTPKVFALTVSQLNVFLSDNTKLYFNPSVMKLSFKYSHDRLQTSVISRQRSTDECALDASESLLAARKMKRKKWKEKSSFPKKAALLFVV